MKWNEIETWHAYFDIFVRNAYGNFRDVLREVSYSPIHVSDCRSNLLSSVLT